jgi:raffinose/stachyose/melibiose transport system permease protein
MMVERAQRAFRDISTGTMVLLFSILVALLVLSPILIILINSFKDAPEIAKARVLSLPEVFTLANYFKTQEVAHILEKMKNSIIISLGVSFVTVLVAFINAYVISIGKISIRGRYVGQFLLIYFMISMLLPPAAIIYPIFYGLRFVKLYNTLAGVILVEGAYWLGFSTFLLSNVLKAFPRDFIDAARVDGASQYLTIFKIVFPLTMATSTTLATILFVWSWNNFFFPLILTISEKILPMPLGLLFFIETYMISEGPILAGAILVSLPMIIFFVIFQRRIAAGIAATGIKG